MVFDPKVDWLLEPWAHGYIHKLVSIHLDLLALNWTQLESPVHIWTHLDTLYPIGLTCTHLIGVNSLELMWTHYDKTYLNTHGYILSLWTHKYSLDLSGITGTYLDSLCQISKKIHCSNKHTTNTKCMECAQARGLFLYNKREF